MTTNYINDDVAVLLVLTQQNIQRGWTKSTMFRDADGNRIELFDDIDATVLTDTYPKIRREHVEPASCCLLGGLVLAAHDSGASDEVYRRTRRHLFEMNKIRNNTTSLIDFNDSESTTKEEAIDLVRAARLALLKP